VPYDRNRDHGATSQSTDQAKTRPKYKAYSPKPSATEGSEDSVNEEVQLFDSPGYFTPEHSGGEAKQLRPKNYSRAMDDEDEEEDSDSDEIIELKEIKRETSRSTETFSFRADFK
jgi:hypothetical protein